ncbi:MAG: hydroxyacylglutathione hydrolase [Nitrosomonas sp.]|nr:hydroxyacylglutathione hydrolase [Nitrosomonas sp.]
MITIHPVRAFKDNYVWIIHNQRFAVIVDPGDAPPVSLYLRQHKLQPVAIFCTHHHNDHTGGNTALVQEFSIPVYGPAHERVPACEHALIDGETVLIQKLAAEFSVLDVPGHTAGHIAFYGHNALFCGDTLFSCGCGRIFEGSAQQMYASLQKLVNLPDETEIYCAHEYTLANIEFARMIDPDNTALLEFEKVCRQKLANNLPTLPSSLAIERTINPFLRCDQTSIINRASQHHGQPLEDPVSVFSVLRNWKNSF